MLNLVMIVLVLGGAAFLIVSRLKSKQDAKVEDQLKVEDSLVNHYKRVINVRNQYPFLKQGIFKNLTTSLNDSSGYVMAYSISLNDQSVIFVHNFGFESATVDNIGGQILNDLNVTMQRAKIADGSLTIGPHSSVVLSVN